MPEDRVGPDLHVTHAGPQAAHHPVHPWVFMVLIAPFGVTAGYLGVSIAWLLAKHGVSVGQIAGIVALSILPHTYKFLWAPIADSTFTRKGWYLASCTLTSVGLFALGALPATKPGLALLSLVVFLGSLATTFTGMAVESLMAYDTPEKEKGRAGGWFQAGNLGGSGVGGGLGLLMIQKLPAPWMAGAILGALCMLCCIALTWVTEPVATHRRESVWATIVAAVKDLWSVVLRTRVGLLALILCFLPLGSGAASQLWAAVASDWKASANTVALVTGVLGGVISAVGCVVGGWVCDRMDRKTAYVLYGVLQAVCAVGMALSPRTEATYIVFTSTYAFITGLTYAGFSAFVLEAMGLGAAATKYSVYASLSNMPIYYMTNIDGWAHDKWGAGGMLYAEAAFGMLGLLVFVAVMAVWGKSRSQAAAAA